MENIICKEEIQKFIFFFKQWWACLISSRLNDYIEKYMFQCHGMVEEEEGKDGSLMIWIVL